MGKKKSILFISNLFPNPLNPNMASFNRQQIVALSHYFDIDVVAPVPWQTKVKKKKIPSKSEVNSIVSYHPTYFYTPGTLRELYGYFFYWSIHSCVKKLFKKKDYHAIYGSWLYPDGWACAKLAKELGVPLFLKVHGTDVNQLQPGSAVTHKSLEAVAQSKAVFCVSQALKKRLIELGADADKLHVVYNGIDKSIFYPTSQIESRKTLGCSLREYILLYVGNLKQTKGLGELAVAFKQVLECHQFNDARLMIVGHGAYESTLKSKLNNMGIMDRVEFLGSLPLEMIAKLMNAVDLLCLPSYMEGVPNVVLEAIACGTPVVATSVGGIPELQQYNVQMSLVPPQEIDALTGAIISRLSCTNEIFNLSARNVDSWQDNATKVARFIEGTIV